MIAAAGVTPSFAQASARQCLLDHIRSRNASIYTPNHFAELVSMNVVCDGTLPEGAGDNSR